MELYFSTRFVSSVKAKLCPLTVCALALLGTTFPLCAAHAQADANNSGASSGAIWIDPRITGEARQIMTSVMETLDPEDRENVVYVDLDDHVYANKPELLQEVYHAEVRDDNTYISPDGEVFVAPPLESRPPNVDGSGPAPLVVIPPSDSGKTGAFRRVYSAATTTSGYSWESANINLTGAPDIYVKNHLTNKAEIPYAYEGGWGANGGAVDAGFQYSPLNDYWSAVALREVPGKKASVPWGFSAHHYKTYETAILKFYVPSNNHVAMSWTASDTMTFQRIEETMVFAEGTGYGWNANGTGCVLKRMTSLAQDTQNLSSGAYIKNIRWYGCLIGTSPTSNHVWGSSDIGGYQSYPSNSPKVSVNYFSPSDETDTINLGL